MKTEYTYYYTFSFGLLEIKYTDSVVYKIKKTEKENKEVETKNNSLIKEVIKQLDQYFDGKRTFFDFPTELQGTDFQKKVWKALSAIPYGQTKSYKEIAQYIGNPKACRAVGLANNKNPLTIVFPCHRVIGSNGKLVGYAGGLEMKKWLLNLEMKNKKA